MSDMTPIIAAALAFASVALLVYVVAQYYTADARVRRRLPMPVQGSAAALTRGEGNLEAFITRQFAEERFGVEGATRGKLRRELLKAGYFSEYAVNYYIFARILSVAVLPVMVFVLLRLFLPGMSAPLVLLTVAVAAFVGILGPDAYLARRKRLLEQLYRQLFPDLVDLLVVCVSAGLSLEAAIDRARGQVALRSRELAMHLEMMGAEIRAGRSVVEALDALASRLGLDEAASFVAMLRQSIELGGDIIQALRVFSDEMRDKRLLRAEEAANKLSVKMVVPLGAFIFPVVLLLVMLPIAIKLMSVLR
jgi:tight adherence protein C